MKEYSHEEYIARNKRLNKGRWRLPTLRELLSLVDYTKHEPASTADINSGRYWSYTLFDRHATYAWTVYFGSGSSDYFPKDSSRYVRCVRDTQDGFEWGEDAPTRMTWYEAIGYAESLNV